LAARFSEGKQFFRVKSAQHASIFRQSFDALTQLEVPTRVCHFDCVNFLSTWFSEYKQEQLHICGDLTAISSSSVLYPCQFMHFIMESHTSFFVEASTFSMALEMNEGTQ